MSCETSKKQRTNITPLSKSLELEEMQGYWAKLCDGRRSGSDYRSEEVAGLPLLSPSTYALVHPNHGGVRMPGYTGAMAIFCQCCGEKRGQPSSSKLSVITLCHHSLGNCRTSGEWSQEWGAYSWGGGGGAAAGWGKGGRFAELGMKLLSTP